MIFLLCFSMMSCSFATEKVNDDMNDFSHYTIASKVAYATAWNYFRSNVGLVPGNMDTMSDVTSYFNGDGRQVAYVVKVPASDLKPGDIVHVKNSAYAFMIYKGYNTVVKDHESDQIVMESLMDRYICSPDTFNQIFDGYAIKFPMNGKEIQYARTHSADGSKITDDAVYDPSLGSPSHVGDALYVKYWNAHQFDPDSSNNEPVKEFVNEYLLNETIKPGSDMDKAQWIFDWVQNHVVYNGSTVGSSKYSFEALTSTSGGNSCDHARFIYAFCKFAGLNVKFHKAYNQFPSGNFTHVWTDIEVDGAWLPADTTSKENTLGKTTYSHIINDYGTYDMLDC